jgi:hypothetical protein
MTQLRRHQARRCPLRAGGLVLPLVFALCAGSTVACSDDRDDDTVHDHEVGDAGEGGSGSDCVESPTTSAELLNACTDAEKIDKNSHPPLLLPDGGVPPLP